MSVIEELISYILETPFEAFPKDIVERAKQEVIDVIGCTIGGANDTGNPMILGLIREWGGKEESTVLGHGVRAPSHNVALANALMSRSFDYGIVDAYVEGEVRPAHIGETLVPTAIAVAEQKAMSGKELLTALILGEDLVNRIMVAERRRGSPNALGAAAVAGRLWGLDNQQLSDAFAIALGQMGTGGGGMLEAVHCFKLGTGLQAQQGIFSVRLASRGFTGMKDPLTGAGGYFAGSDYNPEILTRELGKKFWTSITFKPYPCCRGTHTAIDCTLEILRKHKVKAGDIDGVTVIASERITPPIICEPFTIGRVPHVSAIFSIPYNVANVLVRGRTSPEHFSEESIKDPQIVELARKVKVIKVTPDPFPSETFFAVTVEVKLKDGRKFSEHVDVAKGNEIYNPSTKEERREKFRGNLRFSQLVSMKNAERALSMLEKLEKVEDIREIVKLLVA